MKQWFKRAALAAVCALHLGSVQAADVVIDPGHGGKDPGAIGTLGKHQYYEKDIALDMSLQLRNQLKKQGYSVAMTRSNDTFRSLPQRLAYGRKHCKKLFASVHVNASKHNTRANGVHTYVSRKADTSVVGKKSLRIAQNVQKAFNPKDPHVRRAGFMMLKNTNCPTVQLEMYYMSNKADLKKLTDRRQRHAIAHKLAHVLGKSLREKHKTTTHSKKTVKKAHAVKPIKKTQRPQVKPVKKQAKKHEKRLKKSISVSNKKTRQVKGKRSKKR